MKKFENYSKSQFNRGEKNSKFLGAWKCFRVEAKKILSFRGLRIFFGSRRKKFYVSGDLEVFFGRGEKKFYVSGDLEVWYESALLAVLSVASLPS